MKQIAFIFTLLYSNVAFAQIKFDYTWVLGYPSDDNFPDPKYNGTLIDFNQIPAHYSYFDIPVALDANAAISDSSGNLLFYTDGCVVINRNHEVMANGSGINEGGLIYQQNCLGNYTYGYPTHQGVMIIPFQGHLNQYILLHLRKPDPIYPLFIEDFLYSVVDMTGDGGLGSVVSKNNLVQHDTFCDMLTVVRHGNGRDWWVILPKYNSGEYFIFMLSPQGISAPIVQKIGYPIDHYSWGLQATFSPNGSKYVNHTPRGGLQIFDFDRCSGILSNPLRITFPNDMVTACGVGISSTSRFLYASNSTKLYQFDLKADDIESSKQLVGVYDGFEDVLPTTFYQMMLAPDNKIYMTSTNGVKHWHIIHYPDKSGFECSLEQHFPLPTYHAFSPPNFPYFRLFDAQSSPCDTLGINGPPPPQDTTPPPPECAASIRIFPNPTQNIAYLELPDCQGGSLSVFDVTGRWVEDLALTPESLSTSLDVSRYVPGVYFLRIRTAAGEKVTRRLVVVR